MVRLVPTLVADSILAASVESLAGAGPTRLYEDAGDNGDYDGDGTEHRGQ